MSVKKNLVWRVYQFLKFKLSHASEFLYSFKYYRALSLPIANHLTIGIKVLGKQGTLLPHPVGIVIGKGVIVGKSCTIYQNVTIGVSNNKKEIYPRIGDNVIVYASAIIIGDVTIGDGAVIGAGCIVTKNVPANKIAIGVPMRLLDKKAGVDY
ncbi:serine acetyltransferase [Enterobacter huaxiensis]|uniref:serine acetyltransferase n=1 Tax=Enterobacter huaxiensis TaxID=2494702 RepID=UPI00217579DE|nr:serine acetyltransferase [Enterobacter huaxiensis]MCS5449774.1 serine acetyltransferase [Enterobacter huaxiensis]